MCHWNIKSLAAHNYAKVFLLITYIAVYKCNIVCISKEQLNSSSVSGDGNLEILGYHLIRSDHPSNAKRDSVSIYYKCLLHLEFLLFFIYKNLWKKLWNWKYVTNFAVLFFCVGLRVRHRKISKVFWESRKKCFVPKQPFLGCSFLWFHY